MQDIEALIDEMVAEGLAKATVSRKLTRVRAVFALAMKTKVVSIAPPPTSSPGERPAANRDALTLAEAKAIREKIRGDRYEAVLLLVLVGLRRCEDLGLRWTDIDLSGAALTVRRSRTQTGT